MAHLTWEPGHRAGRSALGTWLSAAVSSMRQLHEGYVRRQTFRALMSLEPWQLDDIGITTEDLEWGLSLPLSMDAVSAMRERARRRPKVPANRALDRRRHRSAHTYIAAPWADRIQPEIARHRE
ncbi:MAG: DUF1127 domain-containing protein [Pseudomonadota bacterium]